MRTCVATVHDNLTHACGKSATKCLRFLCVGNEPLINLVQSCDEHAKREAAKPFRALVGLKRVPDGRYGSGVSSVGPEVRRVRQSRRAVVPHPTRADARRPLPILGAAKKDPGFFPCGCAQGFGWWERSHRDAP